MKILYLDDYRTYARTEETIELISANENAGGDTWAQFKKSSIFRLTSGEQLFPITSDSGVVVKLMPGYFHRFDEAGG